MTEALARHRPDLRDRGAPRGRREAACSRPARHDPTRYDVHMRLGHLALGPEPVPGRRSVERRSTRSEPTGTTTTAERLAPDRFETWVARARMARRRGRPRGGGRAAARRPTPARPQAAEILLESFRMEEVRARRRTSWSGVSDPDATALLEGSRAGGRRGVEAGRLASGSRPGAERPRGAAAAGSLVPPDYAAADRAYAAAARRIAGLLHARVRTRGPDPGGGARRTRRPRRGVRRWRDCGPFSSWAELRARASWARRARSVCTTRADLYPRRPGGNARGRRSLALPLRTRARGAGRATCSRTGSGRRRATSSTGAVEEAPRRPACTSRHARALARTGELDAAEDALLAALLLDASLKQERPRRSRPLQREAVRRRARTPPPPLR